MPLSLPVWSTPRARARNAYLVFPHALQRSDARRGEISIGVRRSVRSDARPPLSLRGGNRQDADISRPCLPRTMVGTDSRYFWGGLRCGCFCCRCWVSDSEGLDSFWFRMGRTCGPLYTQTTHVTGTVYIKYIHWAQEATSNVGGYGPYTDGLECSLPSLLQAYMPCAPGQW